jgi:2-polyprenyl-6-hydroxyphenyl methylase/3-demethylubiquinone-9 3-methyltransferase
MSEAAAQPPLSSSVDPEEIKRFSRIADEWWDPQGKFKPLHALNPARIAYIRDRILEHFQRPGVRGQGSGVFEGLTLIDIGCGGGLISEPMARLGATTTGIDAGEKNIHVAALHAEQSGLAITYRAIPAETLAAEGTQFDVVLALEIIEHVADVTAFLHAVTTLVKPGGLLIMSTLNRTAKSYVMAILGAEYVLRWLPVGTHSWKKFLRPSELASALRAQGLVIGDMAGLVLNPLKMQWEINARDLDVNYLITATKPQ